jgi:hypothetical protein
MFWITQSIIRGIQTLICVINFKFLYTRFWIEWFKACSVVLIKYSSVAWSCVVLVTYLSNQIPTCMFSLISTWFLSSFLLTTYNMLTLGAEVFLPLITLNDTHTHTHTHTYIHIVSAGILWTKDRSVSETSTWQHNTYKGKKSMPPQESK